MTRSAGMDIEISSEEYREMRQRYHDEIYALKSQAEILKIPNRGVVEPQMAYAMSFINNIERCLNSVEISVKMDVLGSIFSGKMVFENGKCRTAEFNPIIAILMGREPFFNKKGASADAETPLPYPVDYLFSNQFMEDLGRIYSLRKYFPSFDDM